MGNGESVEIRPGDVQISDLLQSFSVSSSSSSNRCRSSQHGPVHTPHDKGDPSSPPPSASPHVSPRHSSARISNELLEKLLKAGLSAKDIEACLGSRESILHAATHQTYAFLLFLHQLVGLTIEAADSACQSHITKENTNVLLSFSRILSFLLPILLEDPELEDCLFWTPYTRANLLGIILSKEKEEGKDVAKQEEEGSRSPRKDRGRTTRGQSEKDEEEDVETSSSSSRFHSHRMKEEKKKDSSSPPPPAGIVNGQERSRECSPAGERSSLSPYANSRKREVEEEERRKHQEEEEGAVKPIAGSTDRSSLSLHNKNEKGYVVEERRGGGGEEEEEENERCLILLGNDIVNLLFRLLFLRNFTVTAPGAVLSREVLAHQGKGLPRHKVDQRFLWTAGLGGGGGGGPEVIEQEQVLLLLRLSITSQRRHLDGWRRIGRRFSTRFFSLSLGSYITQ